ncbi:hypothetical protein KDM89_20215, partial [Undibacterium sp. LFS511W]|nr:hypothetical protein [Undibacterium luofuense]
YVAQNSACNAVPLDMYHTAMIDLQIRLSLIFPAMLQKLHQTSFVAYTFHKEIIYFPYQRFSTQCPFPPKSSESTPKSG